MKIRFCEHSKGKGKLFRRLQDEFPDLNIKIKDCIKQCSVCRDTPVATVDKRRVTARDPEELYRKIVEEIRKDGDGTSGR